MPAKNIRSKASKTKKSSNNLIRKPFQIRWLLLVLILGAIASWALGWWQFDVSQPSSGGLTVTIDAPDTVSSGEYIELVIAVTNNERARVTNVEVATQWPTGLKVASSTPEPFNTTLSSWELEDMAVGETQEIRIQAQLFGEEGETKTIPVTVVYELENFSSDFFVEAEKSVRIGEQIIKVTFDDTEDVPPLTETVWRVVIENVDDQNLPVSWVRIILPSGLEDISLQPEADIITYEDAQAIILPVSEMAPGEQQVIRITGQFAAGTQGKASFIWQYGVDTDEEPRIIQEGEYEQYVIGDEAEIEVLFNGEETLDQLSWGDTVTVDLIVRNITSVDLENLAWTVNLTPDVIVWSSVQSDMNAQVDGLGVVRFVPEENDTLKTLAAGEEVQMSFTARLVSEPVSTSVLQGTARLRIAGDGTGEVLSFSKTVGPITIARAAQWHTSAHYFSDEGVQVGSGPLPPRVGETTTYRIQWNIGRVSDSATAVSVSTTLPPDVTFTNFTTSNQGSVQYEAASRRVTWSVPNVGAYDFGLGELEAQFEVSITPDVSQAGSVMSLTNANTLTVAGSEQTLQLQNSALTTELQGDVYSQGKGVVRD